MIYSMTGFGRAENNAGDKIFLIDIRALNGKQFDVRLNIPAILKPFEIEIRNILSEYLFRGSVECSISLKQNGSQKPVTINTELAKSYFKPVAEMAKDLNLDTSQILSTLLKLPDVITPSTETLTDVEWIEFKNILLSSISNLNEHRANEGKSLEKDLLLRIENIDSLQNKIMDLDPIRKAKVREGLQKTLEENVGNDKYDPNRLEQELIYYLEKIDITEEQVRLKNHCSYFADTLNEPDPNKGKKLSFILQEIGREINTTGSKAYDSEIQRLVVQMKDELEKAKEQVLNVL